MWKRTLAGAAVSSWVGARILRPKRMKLDGAVGVIAGGSRGLALELARLLAPAIARGHQR